jgi:hypothetical protein
MGRKLGEQWRDDAEQERLQAINRRNASCLIRRLNRNPVRALQ